MSPMFRVQRQVPGTLLILLHLLTLTTLFQACYTGSNDSPAITAFSLLSLATLAVATDVVETGLVSSCALFVLTYGRIIVFHGSPALCSLIKFVGEKLVPLSLSAYVTTRTATGAIRKTIDFTVELFTILPRATYSIKSEPELLEEGLVSHSRHHSQEPFYPPFPPPTSLETPSEAAVVLPNADRTSTTSSSTYTSNPHQAYHGGAALAAPVRKATIHSPNPPKKSSVVFPTLTNKSADAASTRQTGPDVFAESVALPKHSRKIAQKALNSVDVDKFRGSIVAATAAPRRGRTSLPRILIHDETSKPSFSSSGCQNSAASTASSSPYSTSTATFQTTTPTTPCSSLIDIHHSDIIDREATAALTTTPQLIPATDVKRPKNYGRRDLNEVVWWGSEEATHVVGDHRADSGALECEGEERETQNDDDWRWAKTVGKQRRISISTTSTEEETDSEEDDDEEAAEEEQGFSTRAMRKTMRKSKRAAPGGVASRPFYGASTSAVVKGMLSQEQWDTLEQFEAAPSSPKKMVRSPSPASTRVEAELEVPYWLSAPLPALPEAAPVKVKRLPRLRKFIKKFIPRNFRTLESPHRGRIQNPLFWGTYVLPNFHHFRPAFVDRPTTFGSMRPTL